MPAAEIDIPVELVRDLLREQHRDLADLPLRVLANGWDNVLVRIGEELVARLPRRAVAVDLIRREQEWLPQLAPALPLPIPVPVRLGRPGCGYPWPWTVLAYLPGEPAAVTPPRR